jgi:thiosulfate/3-mercaptopyruvate sulfurtransferase
MLSRKKIISLLLIGGIVITSFRVNQKDPWRKDQLMEPQILSSEIESQNTMKPLIICIGPGALIKGSIDIGPAKEKANLDKLKQLLSKENKNREIVIYCGCCPFEHCPNIRPAFSILNEMKFSNQKLLNLPHNLKADWINKGYPVNK